MGGMRGTDRGIKPGPYRIQGRRPGGCWVTVPAHIDAPQTQAQATHRLGVWMRLCPESEWRMIKIMKGE